MITRKYYLDGRATHREYYAQFVTPGVIQTVLRYVGESRIYGSEDPHFNDIPLRRWDALVPLLPRSILARMKEAGDYPTKAGGVSVLKEAAQQIRDKNPLGLDEGAQ